jgi:hypothetical protein
MPTGPLSTAPFDRYYPSQHILGRNRWITQPAGISLEDQIGRAPFYQAMDYKKFSPPKNSQIADL